MIVDVSLCFCGLYRSTTSLPAHIHIDAFVDVIVMMRQMIFVGMRQARELLVFSGIMPFAVRAIIIIVVNKAN